MLDEPLGSLDRALRDELVNELRTILRSTGVTALYVTHDQDEALALGDRVAIMNAGRFEQIGAPRAVYTHPASEFVARFLGFANLLPAVVTSNSLQIGQTSIGPFPLAELPTGPGEYTLLIRPEAARLAPAAEYCAPGCNGFVPTGAGGDSVALCGTLAAYTYRGREYRVQVQVTSSHGPVKLFFDLPAFQRTAPGAGLEPNRLPELGDRIQLLLYPGLASLLKPEGSARSTDV
jgi:ABC-type Fe3+/spermidine/putrescine transport system ATPase subunit